MCGAGGLIGPAGQRRGDGVRPVAVPGPVQVGHGPEHGPDAIPPPLPSGADQPAGSAHGAPSASLPFVVGRYSAVIDFVTKQSSTSRHLAVTVNLPGTLPLTIDREG